MVDVVMPKTDMCRSLARLLILIAVIAVYALFGEPAPSSIGMAEIVIGLGLVIAVGTSGLLSAMRFSAVRGWQICGALLLAYGLSFATINGVLRDNALSLMFRDIVPFIFMFLPLFFTGFLARLTDREALYLTGFIALLGVVFAARVVLPVVAGDGALLADMLSAGNPALLANVPTVLFAAVLLIGLAGYRLTQAITMPNIAAIAALLVFAVFPIAAMVIIEQRAHAAYLVCALVLFVAYGLWSRPYRMLVPVIVCAAAVYVLMPVWMQVLETLEQKHTMVGLNMRGQEAAAVMDSVGGDILSIMFGNGWGATFVSPAVGGSVVNFTHSLVTAMWLKTGLVGVCLMFLYIGGLGVRLLTVMRTHSLVAIAIAGPFVIDVFLYASYKSLDFGLLLLLIPLWADRTALLKKTTDCSTQKIFSLKSSRQEAGRVTLWR